MAAGVALAILIIAARTLTTLGGEGQPAEGEAVASLYARYRALAGQADRTREVLAWARGEDAALRSRLLGEQHPSLAGAALSELLQGAATRSGLSVEYALLQPPDSVKGGGGGGLRRIAVQVSLRGDVPGLGRFLHEIESATQTLTVDHLQIAAISSAARVASPALGGGAPLQVQVTVSGYALSPGQEDVRR